ncbi:GNAT family N-acetyltransferase [Saccharopolyspora griseoalba]|uniref:GNAT family N-acetyltransferase n=1 Tax=Saccharopolyspora griseoalba TaxID=1431848 RepID=A0ABW2LDH9_9PSEU
MARIFLETPRLVLREFSADDVPEVHRLGADPEVMRYLTGGRAVTWDEAVAKTREYVAGYERFGGHGYWAATERGSGRFLGTFKFHPEPVDEPGNFELGYRLHRWTWGAGYATEGAIALLRKGFAECGVERAWAQTMAVNRGSRRVMEKAGLRYVRTFFQERPQGPIPGHEHGDVEYAVTRRQWLAEGEDPGARREPGRAEGRAPRRPHP